jgi:hypothetical protein
MGQKTMIPNIRVKCAPDQIAQAKLHSEANPYKHSDHPHRSDTYRIDA